MTESGTPAATTHLLDVNALVALANPAHVHHGRVRTWFRSIERWATTPVTEAGFVRLMLNPVVSGRSATGAEVVDLLVRLCRVAGHRHLADAATFAVPAIDLTSLIGHRQVTDLHLVNLAASHGAVLATLDAKLAATLAPSDRRHCVLI